jgi:type I restriction enzyme R subunit
LSQFAFLQREWAAVFDAAGKAEAAVHVDPRTACFYARRALELAVAWAYKHDDTLRLPYQDNLQQSTSKLSRLPESGVQQGASDRHTR